MKRPVAILKIQLKLGIIFSYLIKLKNLFGNIIRKSTLTMLLFFFFLSSFLLAHPLNGTNSVTESNGNSIFLEKRINEIIQRMTIEEKVAMCLGSESGSF